MTTRTTFIRRLLALGATLAISAAAFGQAPTQSGSIVNSKHNLSAGGPGAIRAQSEEEICIFCHTPHNSSPIVPVWNRNMPVNAYTVYHSSSLDALPGQPTGSSKLCLSCHDGTIAVGNVLSREQDIAMTGVSTTLPPGKSNLGTDLSDDHPISFRYDATLAGRDLKLADPGTLPASVKLDKRGEMQCTTCHEPHNDAFGKFLVMNNGNSQLCASCHNQGRTAIDMHRDCNSCHTMHAAPSGPYLLNSQTVQSTCITCHNGQPGATQGPNVASELNKLSRHDTDPPVDPANHAPMEITCNDCHEPHTMNTGSLPGAPLLSPKLGRINGVNAAGAPIVSAQFQYEVCYKCHAEGASVQPTVSRQIEQNNTRLEFAPSAVSFHPIQAAGKNPFVPSLVPGLSTASLIYCTDCHNTDSTAVVSGSGADGPHGSNEPPLLKLRYSTVDGTSESQMAYALCYKCHERNSILSDASFRGHRLHIVDQRTPCSVCHDAHGISSAQGNIQQNGKLINFDISVVEPDPQTGRLEYRALGAGAGQCSLTCHGFIHSQKQYPGDVAPTIPTDPTLDPTAPLRAKPGILRPKPAQKLLPPPPSLRERHRQH